MIKLCGMLVTDSWDTTSNNDDDEKYAKNSTKSLSEAQDS